MAASYSIAPYGRQLHDEGASGLARIFALFRGGSVAVARDDTSFAGPGFAQQVPDLAAEHARR